MEHGNRVLACRLCRDSLQKSPQVSSVILVRQRFWVYGR
jgi:hypothetical protein